MARITLVATFRHCPGLALAVVVSLLWSDFATGQPADPAPSRRGRYAVGAGVSHWADLRDLSPVSPGRFDSVGFVIDFAAHWRMRQWGSNELLFGFDLGGFSHGSDVYHVREEIVLRGMYLTPSVKWQFGSTGARYSLDAGLGYYFADIAEIDTSGYYGYYCCYSEVQLWDNESLGGYIGTTIDFGRAARRDGGGFTMGAKVHWLDLDTVRDEGRFLPVATLGPDAGRLTGPVVSVQLGYAF
jgi:hypothetical protein